MKHQDLKNGQLSDINIDSVKISQKDNLEIKSKITPLDGNSEDYQKPVQGQVLVGMEAKIKTLRGISTSTKISKLKHEENLPNKNSKNVPIESNANKEYKEPIPGNKEYKEPIPGQVLVGMEAKIKTLKGVRTSK